MLTVLFVLSAVGLVSSTVYLILVIIAGGRFREAGTGIDPLRTSLPLVTVLKPLHGLEPFLERNLESFFQQNYPQFEIIFGARDADDPALGIVQSLQERYPAVQTQVVLSGAPKYPNAKVFALEKMIPRSRSPYLVITDSDVYVRPDCLRDVVAPLLDPGNGMVTCLYRGVAAGGFWSKLEALGMSVELTSGVLVA